MRKTAARLTAIGLILFFAGFSTVFGVQKNQKLLDKETYMEMETVRNPNISPGGKHILFTRGWIDKMNVVGTTDDSNWYRQFKQYPWENPMEYALRSPLHYVGNVTTPTMVMTGEADLRTPMGQSEEYYRALKMLKKETLLVRMPDEYHGWRRPSHRLLQQLYLLAWFEKYRVKSGE